MKLAGTTFIQLILALGFALFGIATLVGSLFGSNPRLPTDDRLAVISEPDVGPDLGMRKELRLTNLQTGEETPWRLRPRESADLFSVSPWIDSKRGHLGVARWQLFEGEGLEIHPSRFGIALFSMSDGERLFDMELNLLPISPPCWTPDLRARILFPAGDGKLYAIDLDDFDPQPKPIVWRTDAKVVRVRDVYRPDIPGMENYLLAGIETPAPDRRADALGPYLWWLRIDYESNSVLDAGPLAHESAKSDSPTNPGQEQRWPSVFVAPNGQTTLAYLDCDDGGQNEHGIRLAPLGYDERSGGLKLLAAPSLPIARSRADIPPTFATNGRWFWTTIGKFGDRRTIRHEIAPMLALVP